MATVNLTTNDYASQLAAIARRQKYAELLAQQGAEDIDVQSVGGIPTPISPFQGLAKVLKSGMGSYLGRKAGEDEAEATAAEKKAVNEERARIFGMNPAVAATPLSQGAYQGVDAEGIPSYDVNLPTKAKAASYVLGPEEQMNALYNLGGRSSFGERAATMGMPLAVRGLERADAQTDLAAKQLYEKQLRDAARTQKIADETKMPLTPKEIADRGLRLGTSASIDGFGNVTIDQDLDTLSPEALRQKLQIAAAGRASQGGRSPTPALLQADARAIAKATEASNAAVPSVEALERSLRILQDPKAPANAALPEISFVNNALALFGNETARKTATDARLLRASGDIAGIAALAGIGGSDTERELAVATRTAYSPRGTREENTELTKKKLSAFRFAADYPLLASDWIAKYGSLHPTFKDEDGGTFARFADREYKRIRAEVNAIGTPAAQNTGGAGGAVPANLPPGTVYSPSRKQYRDPSGKTYDQNGKPI